MDHHHHHQAEAEQAEVTTGHQEEVKAMEDTVHHQLNHHLRHHKDRSLDHHRMVRTWGSCLQH